jgi:hypothetical protein
MVTFCYVWGTQEAGPESLHTNRPGCVTAVHIIRGKKKHLIFLTIFGKSTNYKQLKFIHVIKKME